jgi:hypothetical protein
MKVFSIFLAMVFGWAQSPSQAIQESQHWADSVKDAKRLILSGSPPSEDVRKGIAVLLDVAEKIASRNPQLSPEVGRRLRAANTPHGSDVFGPSESEALQAAYRILNGGKDFSFPDGARDLKDIARIAQQHLDRGVMALDSGQPGEALRGILYFVLMITTPVMKQP